jgi:hypothetical protein
MAATFPDFPDPAPEVQCASLEDLSLSPAQIDHLEVVYVVPTTSEAASMAGHLLVAVVYRPDARGVARVDSYGLGAQTGGLRSGSLDYILMGLTGGFYSRIDREAFEVTLTRYGELEDRDLWRYRLKLSDGELRQVLTRLDELRLGGRKPYFFLQRNCTQLLVELLGSLLGPDFDPPSITSPDLMMAILFRLDRLEPLPHTRLQELARSSRARAARALRPEISARATPLLHPLDGLDATFFERWEQLDELEKRLGLERIEQQLTQYAPTLEARLELLRLVMLTQQLQRALLQSVSGDSQDMVYEALRRLERLLLASVGPQVDGVALRGELFEDMLATSQEDRTLYTAHTGYRRVALGPVLLLPGPGTSLQTSSTPGTALALQSALFDASLDEPRHFPLTRGAAIRVLGSSVQLGMNNAPAVRARSVALEGLVLPSRDWTRVPIGFAGSLADVELWRDSGLEWRTSWIRFTPVVSPWGSSGNRSALLISAGPTLLSRVSLDASWSRVPTETEWLALGLPLRFQLNLGSPRQALTWLSADLEFAPRLSVQGQLTQRINTHTQLSLALGEVAGVSVAFTLAHRLEWEQRLGWWGGEAGPLRTQQQVYAGLVLERF